MHKVDWALQHPSLALTCLSCSGLDSQDTHSLMCPTVGESFFFHEGLIVP